MSRTDAILQELNALSPAELDIVHREILRRRGNRVLEVLAQHKGKGQGVWPGDAQEYVNQLRTDDRG